MLLAERSEREDCGAAGAAGLLGCSARGTPPAESVPIPSPLGQLSAFPAPQLEALLAFKVTAGHAAKATTQRGEIIMCLESDERPCLPKASGGAASAGPLASWKNRWTPVAEGGLP